MTVCVHAFVAADVHIFLLISFLSPANIFTTRSLFPHFPPLSTLALLHTTCYASLFASPRPTFFGNSCCQYERPGKGKEKQGRQRSRKKETPSGGHRSRSKKSFAVSKVFLSEFSFTKRGRKKILVGNTARTNCSIECCPICICTSIRTHTHVCMYEHILSLNTIHLSYPAVSVCVRTNEKIQIGRKKKTKTAYTQHNKSCRISVDCILIIEVL